MLTGVNNCNILSITVNVSAYLQIAGGAQRKVRFIFLRVGDAPGSPH